MRRLLEYGKRAMFYIRVLSGYEERRIRNYRLQLEQRLRSAQVKKDAVKRIPEQMILSEVRRMVEEMQNLNKQLETMEADINDYFKPIDKEVEAIINVQMQKEKKTTEMMGNLYKQVMLEESAKESVADVNSADKAKGEMMDAMYKQAVLEKDEAEIAAEVKRQ